jgi:hypothetical protein
VDEYIRALNQFRASAAIARLLQIQRHAALSTIEPGKVCRKPIQSAIVLPRKIAPVRPLNFDHVGTHIRELTRAKRAGNSLFERDNSEATQG